MALGEVRRPGLPGGIKKDRTHTATDFGQVTTSLANLGGGIGVPAEDSICVEVESTVNMHLIITGGPCNNSIGAQAYVCQEGLTIQWEQDRIFGGRLVDGYKGTGFFERKNKITKSSPCDSRLASTDGGIPVPDCECIDNTCPDGTMRVTVSGKARWGPGHSDVRGHCNDDLSSRVETQGSKSFNLCDDEDLLKWQAFSRGTLSDVVNMCQVTDMKIDFTIVNKRQKCFTDRDLRRRAQKIRKFLGGWQCIHCFTCPVVCAVFGSESDTGDINLELPGGGYLELPSKRLHVCAGNPCGSGDRFYRAGKKHTFDMEDFYNPLYQKPDETRALVVEILSILNTDTRKKLDALTKIRATDLADIMGKPFDDITTKFIFPCHQGPIEM